jgi:cystathionine beta-lyase
MVNTPIFRTSTVIFPNLEAYENRRDAGFKSVVYGLHGTPTTFAFEEVVAKLEGGYQAVALPNGLAAIVGALLSLTRDGGHLLMTDGAYAPARNFCERQLRPRGIEIEYYDPLIGAGIAAKFRPDTIALYCESPSSLTFEIQDIPAMARAAHARDIPVLMDNTWGTPYFFPSFQHGVDISIQAATKYINGHSDVMMGVIITNERYWRKVRETIRDFGYGVSPEDCYLALRGIRTMGVRLKQQMASAIEVARFLEGRPEVSRVLYPALESHPGHALWKRDFRGAASLFAFVLKPVNEQAVKSFVNTLKLFGIGSSWGGFESLINIAHTDNLRTATNWKAEGPVIRLHIGLEATKDLIADLDNAFAALRTTA